MIPDQLVGVISYCPICKRRDFNHEHEKPEPRFLIIPELKQGQRWGFAGVIDHPFYKHGPLLQWSGPHGTVMINRQLFYAMMTNRLER